VLVPPQQDRSFYIYLSVGNTSIASVVVQVHDGKEKVVFYLSRRMLDMETWCHEIEKLCLYLFFTCTKLWHILLFVEICHTPFRERGNEASIRVPRMFKSHV
jgi:hypothetical protein